ncbi:sulfatase-like hydrolase/transferase [Flavobacterium sp. FlaQc-48]|uniref:sulfatase-like hydrolase/transferase n=1 Tax=Flavobacterium sp. FlaQc-48 TaxID=3374181 RepID=UPI003756AFE6
MKFSNAFSTGTVCSPSRSCIITGVKTYKLGTGNHTSSYQTADSIHGFPYYLKKTGYYTSNNAKTDYNSCAERRIIQESWNESSSYAG